MPEVHVYIEIDDPPIIPLPPDAPRPMPVDVTHAPEWAVSDARLELYQKCPRRFFFTHVLGIGTARKTTAFSRTHDCLYEVIDWLSETRVDADATWFPLPGAPMTPNNWRRRETTHPECADSREVSC